MREPAVPARARWLRHAWPHPPRLGAAWPAAPAAQRPPAWHRPPAAHRPPTAPGTARPRLAPPARRAWPRPPRLARPHGSAAGPPVGFGAALARVCSDG